jgi:hypothetical protein
MAYYNDITEEAKEEIKEQAKEVLKWFNGYGCDLHHEAFNTDYFITGRYEAKKWLEENFDIFEAIDTIKEYEQDNFGEVYTDLSEPERVANMLVYICGEELLSNSKTLDDKWNDVLTREDCEQITKELDEVEE